MQLFNAKTANGSGKFVVATPQMLINVSFLSLSCNQLLNTVHCSEQYLVADNMPQFQLHKLSHVKVHAVETKPFYSSILGSVFLTYRLVSLTNVADWSLL